MSAANKGEDVKTMTLTGTVRTWALPGGPERRSSLWQTTYEQGMVYLKADQFRPDKGSGEQRPIIPAHVRKLYGEMKDGNYTPTAFSAGLRPRHQKELTLDGHIASLQLSSNDPLPFTDGNHRGTAMAALLEDAILNENEEMRKAVLSLPIEVFIMLDGDTQKDFVNLQMGRTVEAAHMLSLRVKRDILGGKDCDHVKFAVAIAKALNDSEKGPLVNSIRFSSVGTGLPISSLCARGSSDIATSLVGLAKVAAKLKPAEAALFVDKAYLAVKKDAPELLEAGMPLTPPPSGTRGSAGLLIGLGIVLAHRVLTDGKKASGEVMAKLVEAAKTAFAKGTSGSLSGPDKRCMMGEFAAEFCSDMEGEKKEGVPLSLLELLSPSTFGISKSKG